MQSLSNEPTKLANEPSSQVKLCSPVNPQNDQLRSLVDQTGPNQSQSQLPIRVSAAGTGASQPSQTVITLDGQSDSVSVTDCYAALLGLAESFRTMNPPNIRLSVHCLKAILQLKLPANLEARTHLQLGRMLFQFSRSDGETKFHLEKARTVGAHLTDSIKFESAMLLAQFFDKKGKHYEATCILHDAKRISTKDPYWQCKIILQLAQAYIAEGDYNLASNVLKDGAEYAAARNSDYMRVLFLLSNCLLLLRNRQTPEFTESLINISQLLDSFKGTAYQREALRVFYLVLHVSFYLSSGQAKSAHPILRQLHASIQVFAGLEEADNQTNEMELFHWMPREHMVILVYLITVMQSMQSGMMDRAKRSAEKALTQIFKLSVLDTSPLLTLFHVNLLEHTAMGRLVMGSQTMALADIGQACRLCQSNPGLLAKRSPQLHTLIGLYAMSMNCMREAEAQFKHALRLIADPNAVATPSSTRTHPGLERACCQPDGPRDNLSVLISLNLALVHIRLGNMADCEAILKEVETYGTHILAISYCLRAAWSYVNAFYAFCESQLESSKNSLRETVRLGNEEELHRLSALAFITMGQINLKEENYTEGHKMVSAAIHVANRLPDIGIQLWATASLKSVADRLGNTSDGSRWFAEHETFSKLVIGQHVDAIRSQEHRIIHWFDGPLPEWIGGSDQLP